MRRTIRCAHGFALNIAGISCVSCESEKTGRPVPDPNIKPTGYVRARYKPKGIGRIYTCSACGQLGHGKRTCEQLKREIATRAGRRFNPNLIYRPIPAEFAEPAPKRRTA